MYSELNTQGYVSKWQKGSKPEEFGYKGDDVGREKMAEAVYGYLRDPNYIKSKFPDVAKRIGECVNTNPELKDVIQFNSGVGAVGLAAGESRNYAAGGSVGADGAGLIEDAAPALYEPSPDHYDYRYSKAPASSDGAPTWLDTYNAWLPSYKSKYRGDINRSWVEDADGIAQKDALDKQYLASVDKYNAQTGGHAVADKTMLGAFAQPNTFTRPKESDGFSNAVLAALGIAALAVGVPIAGEALGAVGGGAAGGAAEGLAGAGFNAAADSQLAIVAINAAGGDALAGYAGATSAATPGVSGWQAALDAYKAAQPYVKAGSAAKSVADGNPLSAIASYLPGFDFG